MNGTKAALEDTAALRNKVEKLAEEAFHRKLISGYGDGPDGDEYQIVFKGKPRHVPLEQARSFLGNLLGRQCWFKPHNSELTNTKNHHRMCETPKCGVFLYLQ